jgi:hypothetical protein
VHALWQRLLTEHDRFVLFAPIGLGKPLALDTEVPTPTGWTTMGDLRPGDWVLGGDGHPVKVTGCSPVYLDRQLYEVTFRDGGRIRATGDHVWAAYTVDDLAAGNDPRLVDTDTIRTSLKRKSGQPRWSVPLAGVAQYPQAELPIHPYLLGVWLGDGTSAGGGVTFHEDDAEVFDRCLAVSGMKGGARYYKGGTHTCGQTVLGLRTKLRKAGLLRNKHIPAAYLTASEAQRRELLAGLMDTDGCADRTTPRVEFTSTCLRLAQGVLELARSLGWWVTMAEGRATLNGRDCGPKYRVGWTSWVPVFRLQRKADRHAQACAWSWPRCRNTRTERTRTIVDVQAVGRGAARCITVDSADHTFLATRGYVVTHNSSQITRWRVEWELGRNPDLRIGVVSVAKSGVPQKFLSAIRGDIEDNPRLRLVFPKLRPSTGAQRMWGSHGLIVQRGYSQPDPSIQTFGLYGKILGSRLDLIILDDVCNLENTLTAHSRDKMWDWLSGEVFSRLPPEGGGRIWAVGHIWDADDVLERMRRLGWTTRKFSAWVRHPVTQKEIPIAPELWSQADLERRERELGPIMSCLMLRNRLPDRSAGRIRLEWFGHGIERGEGLRMSPSWNPSHSPTYTGVDLGTGVGGDLTCIFTATVLPDGSRQVLDVRSGDWEAPRIIAELEDVHRRYGCQVMVESNQAQRFLTQFASQLTAIPLREHHTGTNKRDQHFGVESLGLEVYNGKWIIPSTDGIPARGDHELDPARPSEMAQAIRELVGYTPDPKVHTGDRAMAWWICRECIRSSSAAEGYTDHPDDETWAEYLDTQAR